MSKFKAHSHYQMYRSDFVFSDYSFIDEEGTFRAVLDNKMWGPRKNCVFRAALFAFAAIP